MKIEIVIVIASAGVFAAGCAAEPEDVHVQRSASSASCEISLDEDVCSRTFEGIDDGRQDDVRRALEGATAFARIARDARRTVDAACSGGLADLGIAVAPGVDDCDALASAVAASSAWLTITAASPTCTSIDPPACAAIATARKHCSSASVTAVVREGAPAGTEKVAAMVERRLGAFVAMKSVLETTAELAGGFSGSVSAIADLPAACVPSVVGYVGRATEDVQSAARRSARVTSALSY